MNQELIDMVRQAGFFIGDNPLWDLSKKQYEAFAALVAAAEREACAKVCDEARAARLAEVIRARGETK
tara:strand:+ start:123 stop:326 length:204 start_codon:yes stop_codon:yes gene_type:complete